MRLGLAYILCFAFLTSVNVSCSVIQSPENGFKKRNWSILVYFAADNNLSSDSTFNLNQMERAGSDDRVSILAYRKLSAGYQTAPLLYSVIKDTAMGINSPIVKSYTNHDSCDPLVLRGVIEDMKLLFPAEHYGVFLWSHGGGWLPKSSERTMMRWFGQDLGYTNRMNVSEIRSALIGEGLDYIVFDACYMGDVEVAYELKDCAKYLLSSQIVVVSSGFPYDTILNKFKAEPERPLSELLTESSLLYHNYYLNQADAYYRTAAISVVDLKGLVNLASAFSNLFVEALALTDSAALCSLSSNVQRCSTEPPFSQMKFDMKDWADEILRVVPVTNSYRAFQTAFSNTVLFSTNTEYCTGTLSLSNLNGLSVFIPGLTNDLKALSNYKTSEWFTNSGMTGLEF